LSTAQIHPFDRVASRYDEMWTQSRVGAWERRAVWEVLDALFSPGDLVLDIGCGTGADCAHLARNGIRVHAADASGEMIRMARRRMRREGVEEAVTTEMLPLERLAEKGRFDGALLNFGVLNCVENLRGAARLLATALRPGARLVVCFMGRFYLWETIRYGLALHWRKAVRRWRRGPVMASLDGSELAVYHPPFAEVRAAFAPHFWLVRHQGIGVFVPFVEALPAAGSFLARLDRAVARWPGIRAMGDHQLAVLVRNQTT
jgi:SAM-dependent methyltransferase